MIGKTRGAMRPQVGKLIRECPAGGSVLDVGCAGFALKAACDALGRHDLIQSGVDYSPPSELPADFRLLRCDLNKEPIPAPDDSFDLVVASHVIEHMTDPIKFFGEVIRVLKPGGQVYFEAPSERSVMLPGMWFAFDDTRSLSFWDDPTHMGRPWPPQAFHRLTRCFDCEPLTVGYHTSPMAKLKALVKVPLGLLLRRPGWVETGIWNFIGWASYAIARKPFSGPPSFHYHSRP
jgi:SAM-dependent methyltransferase